MLIIMNKLTKTFVLTILFLVTGLPANAADKKKQVSLEQASELVRQQSKGKVLSARTTNFNGSKTHRIQVLTPSGRVKIFQIPSNKESFRNQQIYKQRYSQDRLNPTPNLNNRQNHSNYRNPNSNNTSRNKSTSSNGDNKQK